MSRARSGSDWARRASSTSEAVNPGLRFWIHVSNCFSNGVWVRGWRIRLGFAYGFWEIGGDGVRVLVGSGVVEMGRREKEERDVLIMEMSGFRRVTLMTTDAGL